MKPILSILVPAYNNQVYIRRCIESLMAQTLKDIEIILINDGSTDNTLAVMQEYAAQDDRIIIIDKLNSGYGVNINMGIQRAQGKYVGILESDDFCTPVAFEKLVNAAEKYDLEVARANFSLYWSTPKERNELLELFFEWECDRVIDPSNREDQHCFYVQPAIWSAIYRRDWLLENKLTLLETPGAAYQDTAFNFKVWACAHRVMFLHDSIISYRQDNEASSINNPGKVFNICIEYDEIHRWLEEDRPDLNEALEPVANKMMYDAYMWNLRRIAPDLRPEFAEHMKKEFTMRAEKGTLDESLFEGIHWGICQTIINDTDKLLEMVNGENYEDFQGMCKHRFLMLGLYLEHRGMGGLLKEVASRIVNS